MRENDIRASLTSSLQNLKRNHLDLFFLHEPEQYLNVEEIIDIFAVKPSRIIGELKNEIKNQILDGKIKNNKEEALKLLLKLGASKGLERIK